jgi:asparagine synthase (glutamine-hydrolysing)
MCGICGIINFSNQSIEEASIRDMMLTMKHRGPDDEGVFMEDTIGLGFVRLSIIDLSSDGHQPKFSADERYVIVFNGEIFNYIELREELEKEGATFSTKTDTEVLLSAYIQWGEACLHKFNGMWAFVIYDRHTKSVFASRDRFGIKPFYYHVNQDSFTFCSEITPILGTLKNKPTANNVAIFDYLVFNRTDQNEITFFNEIKKLMHGHCLSIKEGKVEIKKWYDLRQNLKPAFKNSQEYLELFSDSLALRLRSDVPVGVCFSGGLDSSSIVSVLLKKHNRPDVNTFSAVYRKGQIGDESEFIDEYKPLLQNMHSITPTAETLFADMMDFIRAHEEPIPGTSPYAQYKVMKLAHRHVTVTIDGQGADEQLAGYHYFFGLYFKGLLREFKISTLAKELRAFKRIHKTNFATLSLIYFLLPSILRTRLRMNERGYLEGEFNKKNSGQSTTSDTIYQSSSLLEALVDHFEFKLEHLLKWEDHNSMHFSIEARVPFLDFRLVERTLSLPPDQLIKNGIAKVILREAMEDIVPEKILTRMDKVGFGTPEAEWFRTPVFKEFIIKLINSTSFKRRGIIKPEKAKKFYEKHLSGEINVSQDIWKWIHLELWFREFID